MRKYKLPNELAPLTDPDLAQLDAWLDRFGYRQVQDLFRERHGCTISKGKLHRYFHRRQQARLLSDPAKTTLQAADFLAIRNGQPLPDERINLELLQRRVLELASAREISPPELKELLDICTYSERAEMAAHRLQIDERFADDRVQKNELRAAELAFKYARKNARPRKAPAEPLGGQSSTNPQPDAETM